MQMVLGNHDFHLLVCALTDRQPNKKDTFQDILSAHDKLQLLDYLLERPLAIKHENALLVHAGAPPRVTWTACSQRLVREGAVFHTLPRRESSEEAFNNPVGSQGRVVPRGGSLF